MSINYEDYDELDSDSSFDGAINIIEDQDGGTIVFNSSELMSANFDGGIPKTVVTTSIESGTDPLDMGDYIFWNFSTNQSFNPSPTDTVDGTIDESDDPADYYDTYLVTGIESDEDEVTYNISVMLEDEEYVIEGVGGTQTIYAIKEDWDEKELGTTGWLITSSGNAIFTNIAARGRIEAKEGFLESLDVNGTLRIIGTPADDETEVTEAIARLIVVQADGSPKTQPSVVINKNGLIVRSNVDGTVKKIFKVPLNGDNILISGYTNDDGNPDNDNPPPDLTGNEIVIGGKNNNITLNGGKGNKAIYTTIQGNRTVFGTPGSGETNTGFLMQLIDTDAGAGETWNTRMRLSGANGSLTFDGSNLTVTGAINATSGNFTNTVNVGTSLASGTLKVGAGSSFVSIVGTGSASTTYIAIADTGETPEWGKAFTPFYVDGLGKFSLGNAITWNPTIVGGPPVLQINGILRGFVNETTGVPVPLTGTNAMGIGLFVNYTGLTGTVTSGSKILTVADTSTLVSGMTLTKTGGSGTFASGTKVATILSGTQAELTLNATASGSITFSSTNATDGVTGIGLKLNSENYWLVDGSPKLKVGSGASYIYYDTSNDKFEVSGAIFSDSGRVGSMYFDSGQTYTILSSSQNAVARVVENGALDELTGTGTMKVSLLSGTLTNNHYVIVDGIYIAQINGTPTESGGVYTIQLDSAIIPGAGWEIGNEVRTNSSLSAYLFSGFGDTSGNLLYAGSTTNSGTDAAFRVHRSGSTTLVKSSAIRNRTLPVAGTPVYITAGGNEFELGLTGSSIRFKKDISDAYNEILNSNFLDLNPVKFKYKEAGDNSEFVYGFIAEQAEELGLDFLYQVDEDGIPDWFGYDRMPVYLFTLVKYQHQKIQELEERLAILEG